MMGPVLAYIHLNSRLQPVHRVSVFEDPLDKFLAINATGSEVVGGGTEFSPETGPLSCDTEVSLTGNPQETFRLVIDVVEGLGAPIGSWAVLGDGKRVAFGTTRGFALVLNGTSLPNEIYANNDVNDVIAGLEAELGDDGQLHSWWEGAENTALYYYGRDGNRLRSILESAPDRYPLAQNSEVQAIT